MEIPIRIPKLVTAIEGVEEITSERVGKIPLHATENFLLNDGRVIRVHRAKGEYFESVFASIDDFTLGGPTVSDAVKPLI